MGWLQILQMVITAAPNIANDIETIVTLIRGLHAATNGVAVIAPVAPAAPTGPKVPA
jgi:hypothetical protein